jgi:uncharacterized protein (TIGR04255 family)
MPAEQIIFSHPPATEVRVEVTFPNNLDVADKRSQFSKLVRAEFPLVVMPEQNKMPYDLADYALYTEDMAERIEIGMSYFRIATTRYPGFRKFRSLCLSALGLFSGCYELKRFSNLAMTYQNKLPVESEHKRFEDIFKFDIRIPAELRSELFTGKGMLVFQKPEGFITIDVDPQAGASWIDWYAFTLYFVTIPNTVVEADKESLERVVDIAHDYVENFFFGMLSEQYLKYLRSK